MKRIFVPTQSSEDWKRLLAKPEAEASAGQTERLAYLHETLGLAAELPDAIRYQLLHRTASAVLTAEKLHAASAVMLVQSFSQEASWAEDFDAFATAVRAPAPRGTVARVPSVAGRALYIGWCNAG